MKLTTNMLSALQAALVPVDEAKAILSDLTPKIDQARNAASRLDTGIADIDRQLEELSDYRAQPDADRVASLIAGADVPLPEKKEVDARASRHRHLTAHREQLSTDVEAVRGHIKQLEAKQAAAQAAHDIAELAFLTAAGDAAIEAFKAAAVDFVRQNLPLPFSLGEAIRRKTGKRPGWHANVLDPLQIVWYVPREATEQERRFHQPVPPTPIYAWPRRASDVLLSGEPYSSPDIVDALTMIVRGHAPDLGARLGDAISAMDANLAADDAAKVMESDPVH